MKHNIKVGIAHPCLGRGGSEARVMWGIEALKKDYDISLITAGNVDLDILNKFYSTSVNDNEITSRQAPIPSLLKRVSGAAALRGALFQRFCRRIAGDFDVLISAYNLCDFGEPSIHCLADFSGDNKIRTSLHPLPPGKGKVIYRDNFLRKCYLRFSNLFAAPSGRNFFSGEDIILANSNWTANLIRKKYGVEVDILYPPVTNEFPLVPIEEREAGFVCIGRVFPEKRIERLIDILKGVRNRGHDIHLHVIGKITNSAYGKKIRKFCYHHREWIISEGSCFGDKKQSLLTGHKFGIHACQGEAFGIGVAEMVKAGCIVFTPSEGGQAEIVNHQSLLYDSLDDAINKIDTVLQQPKLQSLLRNHLEKQGMKFSTNNFMHGLRAAVEKFLYKNERQRKTS